MGNQKRITAFLLMVIDILIINFSYLISYYVRLGWVFDPIYLEIYLKYLPIILITYIFMLGIFKMYRSIWRMAGIDEVISGAVACFLSGMINFIIMEFMDLRVPRIVTALSCLFIAILVLAVRLSFRFVRRVMIYGSILINMNQENVLIYGASQWAQSIIEEIRKDKMKEYKVVGIIDDNENKRKTYLNGIKILGSRKDILRIVKEKNIHLILIAIPSLSAKESKEIIDICKEAKVKIKLIPDIKEMINEEISMKKMRDVDLRDLLGREEITLDEKGVSSYLNNKVVLVTGGGGSIGSELCRQIALFNPKKLLILDIYENNAYDLQNELRRKYPELNLDVIIASVRDRHRLNSIFEKNNIDVIFHAAAHKHVPLMESNSSEAIKNNVIGTMNVAECADEFGISRFVLISTDKAVNPTNVMGATKRICEMIVQALNAKSKTEFVAVRFGNVLGSNGSVVPLFKKQIEEGGPLTLTHKDITRYFMLIPEAARLVLQAGTFAKGGEIFVLDMGSPVKIYDLAENLIRLSGYEPHKDIKIEITGLRPGEKLYEELLMDEEGLKETSHDKIFIGKPGDFEYSKLKDQIEELLKISLTYDEYLLRDKIKKVVPTYINLENQNNIKEVAVANN